MKYSIPISKIDKDYRTLTTKEDLIQAVEQLNQAEYVSLDTETDSLNPRKGQIIGFSFTVSVGSGWYIPTLDYNVEADELQDIMFTGHDGRVTPMHHIAQLLLRVLEGKKLILHNASFDIRFIKYFYGIDLLQYVWCDTALLVHTVQEEGAEGFYNRPFGLKEIAQSVQKEIGLDVEKAANEEQVALKEAIHANGGKTTKEEFEIFKAGLSVLSKYAAADTDLTLRVFLHFSKILEKEGLDQFFYEEEVMPIYKEVTIPMEMRGCRLDMDLIKSTKKQIEEDLHNYTSLVEEGLLQLEETQMWLVDKATTKFPASHKGSFAQLLIENFAKVKPDKAASGKYSLAKGKIQPLAGDPIIDYILTGEQGKVTDDQLLQVSLQLWKKHNGNYIKVSSRSQLGEIVFNYLKVVPKSKTAKGNPQFDEHIVKDLSTVHKWAEYLYIVNRLNKIKSAYVDRFHDGEEDGRYFFYFKQHGTVSGRYGSDAQQLPKPMEEGEDPEIVIKYNNLIRAFMIADEGRVFIDADYESLEPHIFASVSGEKAIQEIFQKGHDFYSTIAIYAEKLQGVSADKKADNYLKNVDAPKRQRAKVYSLGVPYGMEPYALGMTLKIPTEEAEEIHKGYLDGFPSLKQWREDSRHMMKEYGFVKSKVGRVRHLKKGSDIYHSVGDAILDPFTRKNLKEQFGEEMVMKIYRDYKNALNNCLNFQIQSLAASVVNRAALAINREFKKQNIDGIVNAQIHDQLIIDVSENDLQKALPIVQSLMESTTQLDGVTLKAPPEVSHNWRDGH